MSTTPLVALTATTAAADGIVRVRTNAAYVRALEAAGLVPLVLPPLDAAHAERALDAVSGLVLTGGEDVAPWRYGESPHPELGAVNEARDAWELALTTAARGRGLPTLAICRGIQMLNVALGGTLVQDIPTQCPSALPHAPKGARSTRVHEVHVTPSTRLSEVLGAERLTVNSAHHQSIARVADGLRVTARAPDGIIEGAEWDGNDWWAVGVQWHPEELVETPEPWDRGLFARFAGEAISYQLSAIRSREG
ncbi:MAG: gamma-glutamyl-gamma-aminobutyrate hydrolase family protein, partial [Gemmatimonadota bacterium]|nr:gamma-glutamyl-gamma-aminobutyrate hydrolase family protein [Gemmatimonadota bacterium]